MADFIFRGKIRGEAAEAILLHESCIFTVKAVIRENDVAYSLYKSLRKFAFTECCCYYVCTSVDRNRNFPPAIDYFVSKNY